MTTSSQPEIRLTQTTLRVLKLFIDDPRKERSGAEIIRETRVFSGTLYPMLRRLERAGWFTGTWETIDPKEAGRPRQRFYRISALGQRAATEAFAEIGVPRGALVTGGLAWNY
jgi:PadR family transcriptional regulator, regulatory protein PadR